MPGEVLAGTGRERIAPPVDEPDADLPGCFVEQVRLECDEFWREWRRVQRAATGRVPVLLMRRRRSRLLMTIAAEDLFALLAAVRTVEERAR
ncbi:MAG: hypothetical protein KJZ69_09365 [Phycisphaerales bacterium]|nr:hypothetical protein [Phycisphaerales bacterium]